VTFEAGDSSNRSPVSKRCGAEDPTEGQVTFETEGGSPATSKELQGFVTPYMNRTFRYF